jgi:hypothetical protein
MIPWELFNEGGEDLPPLTAAELFDEFYEPAPDHPAYTGGRRGGGDSRRDPADEIRISQFPEISSN